MSEEEKFEAQGRAYAELKKARSNVVTLTTSLQESAKDLEEISRDLDRLLGDPEDQRLALELQERLRGISSERIAARIAELDRESQRALLLKRQTDQF